MDARAIVQEVKEAEQNPNPKPRLQITYRKVGELIPYANNARFHPESQIASLADSILDFDFNQPILIDPKDTVIAGHARLEAAKRAGLDEVPTILISHLDPTRQKAYILADNRIAMDAEWDKDLLRIEQMDLRNEGYDLKKCGFNDDDLKKIDMPVSPPPEMASLDHESPLNNDGKMIECPSCRHRFRKEDSNGN